MQLTELLRQRVLYLWQGPSDLPRSLKLEWRFIAVRWLGLTFLAPGVLLASLPAERLYAVYGVMIVGAVYNAILQWVIPRRPQFFGSGYLTTLLDGLLNIAMV